MERDEFIHYYCSNSGIDKDTLLRTQDVLPCDCGAEICKGWQVVTKSILTTKDLTDDDNSRAERK